MKIIPWDDFIKADSPPDYAVSIGVFDGVHLGHVRLLEKILSEKPGMAAAAVTFSQNPKKLLHPQSFKGNVFNIDQKLEAFAALGLDACVLIDFSPDFGTLSGAEFLSRLARGGVKCICVGPNFRCGHKMDTNAQAMAQIASELGMRTEIVEPVMHGGHPVSSSRIRNSILEGKLSEARRMLGRPHFLMVSKMSRNKPGECAFEFENDAVLPPEGSYLVGVDGGEPRVATLTEERRLNVEWPIDGAIRVAFNELVSSV
jgi:riboflavin kinase/FMN adenylyltransferase